MAEEWIKMRRGLFYHPKIVRIMSALHADRFRIIGGLHAVWSVFDEFSEDGILDGYSLKSMDDSIGWPGFCAAMASVDWLKEEAQALVVPEFDEHNGASSKRRAQDSKRKRDIRNLSEKCPPVMRTKCGPEREREREREYIKQEQKNPPTPQGGKVIPDGFDEFWKLYPKKEGKVDAMKKFRLLAKHDVDLALANLPKHVQHWKQNTEPQFIPQPARWLHGRRWEDVLTPNTKPEQKQGRQSAIFEILANDHRFAQTANRLADERHSPGFPSPNSAFAVLSAGAGDDPDDPGGVG